jgi:prepilin-type N-terminal cleavage/methylation domain-containing protein
MALHRARRVIERAFSLIEIMIVMGLLSVMVLGLMAMFNQTQRAFRLGMNQTDVLEGGRLVSGMLAREIEQIRPTFENSAVENFEATLFDGRNTSVIPLLTGTFPRTNVMQDLFFVLRENQTWKAVSYFVRTNEFFPPGSGFGPVGTLYRCEINNTVAQFKQNPFALILLGFNLARSGSGAVPLSKLIDGVVHFRVRVYDRDGIPIDAAISNRVSITVTTNNFNWTSIPHINFRDRAVPGYVEVELGILEQQALEHYKSIPVLSAQLSYLSNQVGRIHLFRQRVAVRNVDPAAYP